MCCNADRFENLDAEATPTIPTSRTTRKTFKAALVESAYNTAVVAPAGAGMSVLANYVQVEMARRGESRVFLVDVGQSSLGLLQSLRRNAARR